jgi:ribosome modulation factor
MRIDINEQAWNQGFWDGDSGKPSLACPYGVESDERLSWMSGYIEGKAFRNGYIATPPGSRVPLRKSALAAELCAVPLCSTAPSSAAQDPRQRGVKIARRSGVNFGSRLTPRTVEVLFTMGIAQPRRSNFASSTFIDPAWPTPSKTKRRASSSSPGIGT